MKAKMDMLLLDDLELLLNEINEFCGPNSARLEEIPQSIENYLHYVAKTGNTVFPWQHVRPLFKHKLNTAIGQFQGESSSVEPCVHERFDLFRSAPFTIQRLAELVLQPQKHYKTKEKFVCALEKTVFVVSTVEPKSPYENEMSNGNEEELDNEHLEDLMYEESEAQHEQQHHDLHLNNYSSMIPISGTVDSTSADIADLASVGLVVTDGGGAEEPKQAESSEHLQEAYGVVTEQHHHHHDLQLNSYNTLIAETVDSTSTSLDIAELASVGLVVTYGMEETKQNHLDNPSKEAMTYKEPGEQEQPQHQESELDSYSALIAEVVDSTSASVEVNDVVSTELEMNEDVEGRKEGTLEKKHIEKAMAYNEAENQPELQEQHDKTPQVDTSQ